MPILAVLDAGLLLRSGKGLEDRDKTNWEFLRFTGGMSKQSLMIADGTNREVPTCSLIFHLRF
jgi:hypothetical protein